ncbi:Vacuolar membrane protein like [Verticillium longisporum]|uniref:Vacuolar membrane protein like n=1 Tax=Verticillium longisporum TaxID=100787 RepID=A0A8I2ZDE0_VERLO|nr:Vacuolar membrane protein like [Verticillium longisporum]
MAPPAGFAIAVEDASTTVTAALATLASPSSVVASLASVATATTATPTPTSTTPADAAAAVAVAALVKPSEGDCELLGNFALLVQLALGGLALLVLVYKRWKERPQRPVKIWFFDVSKQVFGSVLVHIANVFMSMLTSGRFNVQVEPASATVAGRMLASRADDYTPNPCSFYLLNLAIDTTVGIPILIGLLKVFTLGLSYTPLGKPAESIQSGNYGSPPNAWWWLKQSLIYFCGLFGMKVVVLLIFLVFPWISRVGDWALRWTEGNEQLQIFFVMMFFPLIMNAMQYYIIDSFIKKAVGGDHERVPEEDPEWASANAAASPYDDRSGLFDSDDEQDQDSDATAKVRQSSKQLLKQDEPQEYDPDLDGDAQTIVAFN